MDYGFYTVKILLVFFKKCPFWFSTPTLFKYLFFFPYKVLHQLVSRGLVQHVSQFSYLCISVFFEFDVLTLSLNVFILSSVFCKRLQPVICLHIHVYVCIYIYHSLDMFEYLDIYIIRFYTLSNLIIYRFTWYFYGVN